LSNVKKCFYSTHNTDFKYGAAVHYLRYSKPEKELNDKSKTLSSGERHNKNMTEFINKTFLQLFDFINNSKISQKDKQIQIEEFLLDQ